MTDTPREITLDTIPGMVSSLLKAALSAKPKSGGGALTPLRVSVDGVTADAEKLALFREVCGCGADPQLPLTYPHIMAFALHMRLMSEPEFPFKAMGLVHISNRIRQLRSIDATETMDITAYFGEMRQAEKGTEFEIITEARINGELVWDDLSTMLRRGGGSGSGTKSAPQTPPVYAESVQWHLPANNGRRYAKASGDYNPIHLWPITAKALGFKRQIMHGMWSKSASVAHLTPAGYAGPVTADVSFKLPIFLPADVQLLSNPGPDTTAFEMRDGKGEKPHLKGELRFSTDL